MSQGVVQEAVTAVPWAGLSCDVQYRPEGTTMTDQETALRELLAKGTDASLLRDLTTKSSQRDDRLCG